MDNSGACGVSSLQAVVSCDVCNGVEVSSGCTVLLGGIVDVSTVSEASGFTVSSVELSVVGSVARRASVSIV